MIGYRMEWTEEKNKQLRQLWEKMTASQIAAILGCTRNAVIGAANRLGMRKIPIDPNKPRKPRKQRRPRPQKLTEATLVAPQQDEEKIMAKLPPPIEPPPEAQNSLSVGVPLLDAKVGACRAIIGSTDDGRALAVVCGKPVDLGNTFSFCPEHMAQFTVPRRH